MAAAAALRGNMQEISINHVEKAVQICAQPLHMHNGKRGVLPVSNLPKAVPREFGGKSVQKNWHFFC